MQLRTQECVTHHSAVSLKCPVESLLSLRGILDTQMLAFSMFPVSARPFSTKDLLQILRIFRASGYSWLGSLQAFKGALTTPWVP